MRLRAIDRLAAFAVCAAAICGIARAGEQQYPGDDPLEVYDREEPVAEPESPVQLPDYPDAESLIEVDTALNDFPFTLLVDADSVSLDDQGVVRLTLILRSASGVDNVSYEGFQCADRRYRRYAYGVDRTLRPLAKTEWRYIRKTNQDRHRSTLVNEFICTPAGGGAGEILRRLEAANPARHGYRFE